MIWKYFLRNHFNHASITCFYRFWIFFNNFSSPSINFAQDLFKFTCNMRSMAIDYLEWSINLLVCNHYEFLLDEQLLQLRLRNFQSTSIIKITSWGGLFLNSPHTSPLFNCLVETPFTLKPMLSPGIAYLSYSWCISIDLISFE